jgi:sulfite reductase beta subunit-like hemoprotein
LVDLWASQELAGSFGGPTLTFAQGVILLGPDFCRSALTDWAAYLPKAIKGIAKELKGHAVTAHYILAFLNIAGCSG